MRGVLRHAHCTSRPDGGWETRANCAGVDPEGRGRGGSNNVAADFGPGLAVCADCPVTEECFLYGVGLKESGVYGGVVLLDGKVRTPRQRPQQTAAASPGGRTVLAPCGTIAAYERHRNHGTVPCKACVAARAEYDRGKAIARRQRGAA